MSPIPRRLRVEVLADLKRRIQMGLVQRLGVARALLLVTGHTPDDVTLYDVSYEALRNMFDLGAPFDAGMLRSTGLCIEPAIADSTRALALGEMLHLDGVVAVHVRFEGAAHEQRVKLRMNLN